MASDTNLPDYGWSGQAPHTQGYLYAPLQQLLCEFVPAPARQTSTSQRPSVLDLGCGNGALAEQMQQWGYAVIGIDPSPSGLDMARARCPNLSFHQAIANPESIEELGLAPFDLVVSTEVVEHCYSPRQWAAAAFSALKPGGVLISSTPYHGYLKNLTLAASGKLDAHFTALWDGGHIKFWSRRTLTALLQEAGFELVDFRGAGRWPWLWKSMLIAARKPLA